MPGTLFVVATPIGNLEDITLRALRVLREVTLIAAEDTRRTGHLLARHGISTPTTSLHEHNEAKKTASIVARLQRGDTVALVSDAGTPTISDPGHRLIRAAIEATIRVEPIPGPNAAVATLAVSGFPSECFTFLGFPPIRSKNRMTWFERMRLAGGTVVFYEAPHRIRRTLQELHHYFGNCPIIVGRELTKAHEEVLRGPVSDVLGQLEEPRGEFTVVADIGHSQENTSVPAPGDDRMLIEFGETTNNGPVTRRRAIARLASRYRMTPNAVYAAIERAKKLVK
jgi:16S rRNA (cytidine1402-2'-O)-methyltransferase